MKKTDIKKLCMGCMKEKTSASCVCPHCGFDEKEYAKSHSEALPLRTVLKNKYIIGKQLGNGGFGITYLSYDLMIDVQLAIKEYYPSGIATRLEGSKTVTNSNPENEADFCEGLEKFLAEARALAKFSEYANIVSVRDYFEYNGTAYMVMGYLEGQTLLQYLKQQGNKLPFAEIYKILSPVMDALNAVHASGLIHRDISPDNIFIAHDGTVRLLDFGAAKTAMSLANHQSHSIVLKKAYSPAEQYRKNGQLGPWTDVYSMGATFYRCLIGEAPQDSIDRLFEDEVARNLKDSALGIPAQVTDAILKAMSINEADRFQNMSDFKFAMNEKDCDSVKTAINKAPEQPQADASKNEVSEEIKQPAKTKQKIIVIIAAVLCLVIVAFAVYSKMRGHYANKMYEKGSETEKEMLTGNLHWHKYIAAPGENLSDIAKEFKTTVAAIRKANCLPDKLETLSKEKLLYIPDSADDIEATHKYVAEQLAEEAKILRDKKAREAKELREKNKMHPLLYCVQKGDTVAKIAKRFHIKEETLLSANPGKKVRVGAHLKIPTMNGIYVTVGSRDSVPGLARCYGSNSAAIMRANGLEKSRELRVGMKLFIPGGKLPEGRKITANKPIKKLTSTSQQSGAYGRHWVLVYENSEGKVYVNVGYLKHSVILDNRGRVSRVDSYEKYVPKSKRAKEWFDDMSYKNTGQYGNISYYIDYTVYSMESKRYILVHRQFYNSKGHVLFAQEGSRSQMIYSNTPRSFLYEYYKKKGAKKSK